MKKCLSVILFFFLGWSFAQTTDKELVSTTVNQLFTAIANVDKKGIRESFTEKPILETINKEGEVHGDQLEDFITIVKNNEGALVEKIEIANINVDGNLASVWAPYQFFYNEKFSHCGVNQLTLVKVKNAWKILHIIDTRRKENCN